MGIGSGVVTRKNSTVKILFAVIYLEHAKWSKRTQRFTACWRYSLSSDITRLQNGICRQTNDVCMPLKTLTKPEMNVNSEPFAQAINSETENDCFSFPSHAAQTYIQSVHQCAFCHFMLKMHFQ